MKETKVVTSAGGSVSAPAARQGEPGLQGGGDDHVIAAPWLSVAPNWIGSATGTGRAVDPTTKVAGVRNVPVMPLMLSVYALVAVTV